MLEPVILNNLCTNERYARYVCPYILEEYFDDRLQRKIFGCIKNFIVQYDSLPNFDVIRIMLNKDKSMSAKEFENYDEGYKQIFDESDHEFEWLVDETEKWCKDRAVFNAIAEAIEIREGNVKGKDESSIVDLMTKAVSVSFNTSLGHDYFGDAESRYEYYINDSIRIDTGWSWLDFHIDGGIPPSTLFCITGKTNSGKSICLTHQAAYQISQGRNVVYISFELSEESIAQRIDANLLNCEMNRFKKLEKDKYLKSIHKLNTKCKGKLYIKEYPANTANTTHISTYLDELKRFNDFIPDVIIIDYLTICGCIGYRGGDNMYLKGKYTAEELRALASKYKVPVFTALQYTRQGGKSSDPEMEDTGESYGIPHTADLMVSMINNPELDLVNQVGFKITKNRFGPKDTKFNMEMNKPMMYVRDIPGAGCGDSAETEIRAAINKEMAERTSKLKINTAKFTMDD